MLSDPMQQQSGEHTSVRDIFSSVHDDLFTRESELSIASESKLADGLEYVNQDSNSPLSTHSDTMQEMILSRHISDSSSSDSAYSSDLENGRFMFDKYTPNSLYSNPSELVPLSENYQIAQNSDYLLEPNDHGSLLNLLETIALPQEHLEFYTTDGTNKHGLEMGRYM